MGVAKVKFMPEPRGWTQVQVCARLGLSLSRFQEVKKQLKDEGMPQPDPITGRTDANALEAWMDRRSGLVSPANDAEALALLALHGKRAS